MDDDTLTRARAVLATIRATREAGYLAASSAWDSTLAPSIELDATPALIRLAEVVARLRARSTPFASAWEIDLYDEPFNGDGETLAAEIDAALAELAALDGAP